MTSTRPPRHHRGRVVEPRPWSFRPSRISSSDTANASFGRFLAARISSGSGWIIIGVLELCVTCTRGAFFIGCREYPVGSAAGMRGKVIWSGGAASSAKKPAPVPSVNTSGLASGDRRTDWFIGVIDRRTGWFILLVFSEKVDYTVVRRFSALPPVAGVKGQAGGVNPITPLAFLLLTIYYNPGQLAAGE